MILKKAIDDYLNRSLSNHTWMKDLTKKDLDELIANLEPRPNLYPHLHLHQKVSFYLGITYPAFSYWLDMGSGKSLLALELLRYWWQCGDVQRALIFVLSDKAYPTWEMQIKKFGIDIPTIALEGSSAEKWEQLERFDKGIILLTYPGAVAMCTAKVKGKRNKNKLRLQANLVQKLCTQANMIIMDESTKLGNIQSLSHQICAFIAKRVTYRYALAGRPFGRDPTMLWAQQKIIDNGESFGETKGLFQAAFFSKAPNKFSKSPYAFDYTFKKSMAGKLSRMMQHRSITYEEHELQDLPDTVKIKVPIPFSLDSQAYYRQTAQELAKTRGNFRETKNLFLRMRQITSGFLGFKDDETGEKASLAFTSNPKLERLVELLEELPSDRKAVIFYDYTWSALKITNKLSEFPDSTYIWLWSGTKDPRKQIAQFISDPDCRFAVINNKVGAFSLDGLQEVANYLFFYESPVSVIEREQAERRIRRQGQKRKVYMYDLCVPDSVDERILDFHKDGRDLMTAIRKDPTSVLK